ncbi:ester cyclase [Halalkalicoccus sp. NIPERK01]|uniref:ester cyclase n=1 Tax=Halalkalicoccus sp. NIPERK01 TaxID=3053469 RepID=UPI00256F2471|nr:ester cyclase [Halalkalicoccus sp. NIPERK01]MDL5362062.1 ester cyclase [Halalkalicoccus sp. NIPERK01]
MGRLPPDDGAPEGATTWRNEGVVRGYFEAVWNGRDLGAFDTDAVSDGYVLHHGTDATYSVDDLRTAWADWHEAFPDARNEIEDVIAAGDRVVVRYRFTGTQTGPVLSVPATGRAVETAGIVVFRVDDGRLVEAWAMDDVYSLLKQLGAIPERIESRE